MVSSQEDLFQPVIELPEPTRQARYQRLVGLDHIKIALRKEASLLADRSQLDKWAGRYHKGRPTALDLFADRAPLFVFAGDVGAGKTALAESFGCDLSEQLRVPAYLYRLKLSSRGSGLVGEMTTLIGDAFTILHTEGKRARTSRGINSVLILVVDEADALAQSRASSQMHHEDRSGVDAVLQGVDGLAGAGLPIIVVMCTNRGDQLDPAVLRRAAAIYTFGRPDAEQRRAVLTSALTGLGISPTGIEAAVQATGPRGEGPAYTYSDLTQRLVPAVILAAFPDRKVDDALLLSVVAGVEATPVFTPES